MFRHRWHVLAHAQVYTIVVANHGGRGHWGRFGPWRRLRGGAVLAFARLVDLVGALACPH